MESLAHRASLMVKHGSSPTTLSTRIVLEVSLGGLCVRVPSGRVQYMRICSPPSHLNT
jgi:hypothetical protein